MLEILFQNKVHSITDTPGFFRDIPPIQDAIEAVKEISSLDG